MSLRSVVLSVLILGLPAATPAQERVGTSTADLPSYNGAFSIENTTNVAIPYEFKWGSNRDWKHIVLQPGRTETHSYPLGDNSQGKAPSPFVRFDGYGGDNLFEAKEYHMQFYLTGYAGYGPNANRNKPKAYYFQYAADNKTLNLFAR